jgi:hypothetical protein
MSDHARRQLADLFERLAELELRMLECPQSLDAVHRDLTRVRVDFYRFLKETL